MAMIKRVEGTAAPLPTNEPVSLVPPIETYVKPASRDYGAEARGKVTFGAYQAAIESPGVLSFSASIEEYDKNIEKYAQLIIRKTWEAQNGK